MKTSRKLRRRSLQFETLERREVMAASVTAALDSTGVLNVMGTDADDQLYFQQTSKTISINGVDGAWSAQSVKKIVIDVGAGNDFVSLNSLANGGNKKLNEKVWVRPGEGEELVRLAKGSETHFGSQGQDSSIEPVIARRNGSVAASIKVSLKSGVLKVNGTDAADNLKFRQTSGMISIGGVTGSWAATKVNSIVVNLQGGDDYVSLDSLANGGNQALQKAITVNSGAGNETVHLANGHDVTFSGTGHTLKVATNGTVTLDGTTLNFSEQVQATFSNGILTVTATNGADNLKFMQSNGWLGLQGGVIGWYSASTVNSIVINLRDGDDYVSLDSLNNGGNQAFVTAFTINSGAGNETVHLANGHDVTFSGAGHQLKVSASGTVTLDGVVLNFGDPAPPPPPPAGWFEANIQDAALRSLGASLYVDGLINRSDIMSLFQSAQDGSVVDSTEFNDLKKIVTNTTLFGTFDYVWKLSSYIVNGNTANAKYQGGTLGNLAAGSTDVHLGKLVNKWFLGLDRPTASGTYRQIAGTLYVSGAAYTDVRQGSAGDCYLMAALAEFAQHDPAGVTNMFIVNGDGTYTVRFYNNGAAEYVTVDSYLPTNGGGGLIYAGLGMAYNNTGNELWVPLAEKAFVQLHEMGWVRPGLSGNGLNSYAAINGGYISSALRQLTAQATATAMTSSSTGFTTFVNAYNAGEMIGFATKVTPASSNIVASHAYTAVGYNSTNKTVTLFNPWGIQYGLVTLSWSEIQANFSYFDRTV